MLAAENLATVSIPGMAGEANPRERLQDYVTTLLRAEVRRKRGNAKIIAEKTGTSAPHISNMAAEPQTRRPGDEFIHKFAQYLGKAYSDLEAEAMGRVTTAGPEAPDPFPEREEAARELMARGMPAFVVHAVRGSDEWNRGMAGRSKEFWREVLINELTAALRSDRVATTQAMLKTGVLHADQAARVGSTPRARAATSKARTKRRASR